MFRIERESKEIGPVVLEDGMVIISSTDRAYIVVSTEEGFKLLNLNSYLIMAELDSTEDFIFFDKELTEGDFFFHTDVEGKEGVSESHMSDFKVKHIFYPGDYSLTLKY